MSFAAQLQTIKPFNGQDFDHWKRSILTIFQLNGLAPVVTGTKLKPTVPTATVGTSTTVATVTSGDVQSAERLLDDWIQADSKALGTFNYTIIPSIRILFEGDIADIRAPGGHRPRYASEVWQWLTTNYEKRTRCLLL